MLPGDKTQLRALDRADLKSAVAWLNDPAVRKLVATYKPVSMSEEERWYERTLQSSTDQVFAIDRTDVREPAHVGLCGIHEIQWKNRSATVGILIGDTSLWGKGYGTDAMRSLVRYAHDELGLVRVALEVLSDNTRAIGSYEKLGFVTEGVRRSAMWRNGGFRDLLAMSILPGELTSTGSRTTSSSRPLAADPQAPSASSRRRSSSR